MPRGEIEVTTLQDAFDRSGLSQSELARRLGFIRAPYHRNDRPAPYRNLPDVTRVKRIMGRAAHSTGPGTKGGRRTQIRRTVEYETALKFIQACGFDPVDFGL